jgi:hypothetical protein
MPVTEIEPRAAAAPAMSALPSQFTTESRSPRKLTLKTATTSSVRLKVATPGALPATPTLAKIAVSECARTPIDHHGTPYYFRRVKLGEPRQGAERPSALGEAQHGDPPNLIQVMLA